MHILIVSQYFWPEEFRINDLAIGLKERGHQVTVLTGKPNYPGGRFFDGYGYLGRSREDFHGIDILRVPLVPRGKGGAARLVLNYSSFALTASTLGPFRCRSRYDAMLVFQPSPITVGLPARVLRATAGIPVLFWVQDLWPESLAATGAVRSGWALKLAEKLTRFVYRGCDRILVQSRAFVEPIVRMDVARSRIEYFPNSAEALYQPCQLPDDAAEHSVMPAGFRVLFAGNIGAAQDFETIIAAAELLKAQAHIHWCILGDGRMAPWVRDQIAKRRLEACVHLLGRHPMESMPRWFAAADALLVTLKRDPIFALTIPSKLQSYLACARPIVAALEGEGARVVSEAGAGFTAAPENAQALARAVQSIAALTPEERAQMGHAGRRYFERHFERGRLLDQLEAWMLELRRCAS